MRLQLQIHQSRALAGLHRAQLVTLCLCLLAVFVLASPAWALPVTYTLGTMEYGELAGFFTLDTSSTSNPFTAWNLTYMTTNWDSNAVQGIVSANRALYGDYYYLRIERDASNYIDIDLHIDSSSTGTINGYTHVNGLYVNGFRGNASSVPEPSSMLLLGIGLFGLAGYQWQRQRQERSQVG